MRVLVVSEQRFACTTSAVWARTASTFEFWTRYHGAFDEVLVAARVEPLGEAPAGSRRADGPGVRFCALPYYVGPRAFLRVARQVRDQVRRAFEWGDAVIARAYSPLSMQLLPWLSRAGYPYALEVVSDPRDAFASGGVRHPLRPVFRLWFARSLRRQCGGACAVAYVTESALQRRYPARSDAFTTHYSSVALDDRDLASGSRTWRAAPATPHVVFVGSLAQMYKGPDLLLDAAARCVRRSVDLQVTFVGDGQHRAELARRAAQLGLSERARFLGEVPAGDAVRRILDQADLFVLPSRTEGLPRAMIEAMARGTPCIGAAVGGIPELLPAADLVPAGDVIALADLLETVTRDPARLAAMSARNLARAAEYRDAVLRTRRDAFYREVRARTAAWLRVHPRP